MDKEVELNILDITDSMVEAGAFAMLLSEINGNRQLPIIIGPAEAQAILLHLNDVRSPRPLTHDLFVKCFNALQSVVTKVLIYEAEEGVFFSYVYFEKETGESFRTDARTSDAVAIAIRFDCPIFIYESVLEKECIRVPKTDSGKLHNEEKLLFLKSSKQSEKALKKALEKAVKEENYELAAQLRDKLKSNED